MATRVKKRLGRPPASDGVQTRQRILDAALRFYGEHGYEKSTNKDIAEAAGLTMASIYYYYDSKADLYIGVCEEVRSLCVEILEQVHATHKGFVSRISNLFREVLEAQSADPALANFVVSAPTDARRYPELQPGVEALVADLNQLVRMIVEEGIAAGDIAADADPETVTSLILALLFGMAFSATMVPPARFSGVITQLEALIEGTLVRRKGRRLSASQAR